jgi:hypothetical protein
MVQEFDGMKYHNSRLEDVLNEFHDRLCEIESALEREESYQREQRER